MKQPDNTGASNDIDEIVAEIATKGMIGMQLAMHDGSPKHHEKVLEEAKQLIEHLIAQEANKAVIQELVIVKTNPYAINNLELRKWIDERIKELTADKEQADE